LLACKLRRLEIVVNVSCLSVAFNLEHKHDCSTVSKSTRHENVKADSYHISLFPPYNVAKKYFVLATAQNCI